MLPRLAGETHLAAALCGGSRHDPRVRQSVALALGAGAQQQRAHRGGLGGGGDAAHDRAEHRDDEQDRRGGPLCPAGPPLAPGVSLGMHESQGRMWETLVGRSLPFWRHFFPRLEQLFPEPLAGHDAERWYREVNAVQPSLIRVEADEAGPGEIIAVAGLPDVTIGETLADPEDPRALPVITVDEPSLSVTIGQNTSPLAGKEGSKLTARQIKDRLDAEMVGNVSIRVLETERPDAWEVQGRGELQLAVLVELMRREGFELTVGKPQVVTREIDGKRHEPVERLARKALLAIPAPGVRPQALARVAAHAVADHLVLGGKRHVRPGAGGRR